MLSSGFFIGPMVLGYAEFKIEVDESGDVVKTTVVDANPMYVSLSGLDHLVPGEEVALFGSAWNLRFLSYLEKIQRNDISPMIEKFFQSGKWSQTSVIKSSSGTIITHCIDMTPFYTDSQHEKMQENSYKFFLENIQGLAFQVMKGAGSIQVFQVGSYEAITGYPIEKFKEMEFFLSLIHHEDLSRVTDYNARLYKNEGSYDIEYRVVSKEGKIKWLRSYDQHIVGTKGLQMIQGIMFDITAQKEQALALAEAFETIKEQNVKLDLLSRTDPLTGLENRRSFIKLLNIEIDRYKRKGDSFALVMLDIDHFKAINDVHGHDTGDDALVLLANTFISNLRKMDHMGRWGGEEFLILLASTTAHQALFVIEKLQNKLKEITITGPAGSVSITFSAGIVEPHTKESTPDLITRADQAMYRAKAAGRNRIILDLD